MALNFTPAGERISVDTINVLIYGQPSAGKTSLAYTCSRPLVLDFDRGAHRSMQAPLGTTVRIDSWADVEELQRSDLSPYDTLVIDTTGSALDLATAYIIQTNPKMGTAKGTLTMQGYGELKAVFAAFFKRINTLGKDVVMIAHHREEKEGDSTRKRPDIQGSSYGAVLKVADFVGFAHLNEASRRVIGFAPTADYFGKDSAKLGVVEVADFDTVPTFGADLIRRMKSAFASVSEEHAKTVALVSEWRAVIDAISSADEANGAAVEIKTLPTAVIQQVKPSFAAKVKELGLTFDKAQGVYA